MADITYPFEGALADFEIDELSSSSRLSSRIRRPGQKPCKSCNVDISLVGLLVDLSVILLSICTIQKTPIEVCNLCRSTGSTQCGQSPTRDNPIPIKHSSAQSASDWTL
jgi:hypothetical protein